MAPNIIERLKASA